jgi:4-amino-4-deoxy-L-arabinose transferase-like glycosyltransferase
MIYIIFAKKFSMVFSMGSKVKSIFENLNAKTALVSIIIFSIILRVLFIWSRNLGNDEPFTLMVASGTFENLVSIVAWDPSMLYYFTTFFVYKVLGIFGLYLMTVIGGVVSVFLVYKIAKILFNERIALLSTFLLAISPMHILYSQHLRVYSLTQMFVLFGILFALQYSKSFDWKKLVLLSLSFLLAAFIYYPAIVVFLVIYGFLLWKILSNKKSVKVRFVQLFCSFAIVPAIFLLLVDKILGQVGFVATTAYKYPLVENFFYYFYKHFSAVNIWSSIEMFPIAIILGVVLSLCFAYGVYLLLRKKKVYLLSLIFLPIFAYYLAYTKFSLMLYFKHMSATMPLIFIVAAFGLLGIQKKNTKLFYLLLGIIIIASLLTTFFYYFIITNYVEWIPIIGH